jgi:hypothetical protein
MKRTAGPGFVALLWWAAGVALVPVSACAFAPDSIAPPGAPGILALERPGGGTGFLTFPETRRIFERRTVRVHLGEDAFRIHDAMPGPDGLAFAPGAVLSEPAAVPDTDYWMVRWPAHPASPISWDRIDRIDVRRPSGKRGAVVGCVVGFAFAGSVMLLNKDDLERNGWVQDSVLLLSLAFGVSGGTGAILGAGVGSLIPHWKCIGRRAAPGAGAGR